jgi:hypothetical protein
VTVCLSFPIPCGTTFISGVLLLPVLLLGFPSWDPLPRLPPFRPDDDWPLPPAWYVTEFTVSLQALSWLSESLTYGFLLTMLEEAAALYDLKESAQDSIVQCLLQLYSTSAMVCLSRSFILGLSPYTLYSQVALNIVNCQ